MQQKEHKICCNSHKLLAVFLGMDMKNYLQFEDHSTTRKRVIGPGHRYRLQQQLVPLAFDRPSGGQLAPGGGSNWFQCVSIGTGLNHHPVPNEGGDIGTG